MIVTVSVQERQVVEVYKKGDVVSATPITWGPKKTGTDGGFLGQQSIDNDFIYTCVKAGDAGEAIWKRSILFAT